MIQKRGKNMNQNETVFPPPFPPVESTSSEFTKENITRHSLVKNISLIIKKNFNA